MNRVAVMAAAGAVAPPSPELCLIAGMILSWTNGKPERIGRLVEDMRRFAAAHREFSHVSRLRGSEYDADVLESMEQASGWLDRLEPFLMLMAKR